MTCKRKAPTQNSSGEEFTPFASGDSSIYSRLDRNIVLALNGDPPCFVAMLSRMPYEKARKECERRGIRSPHRLFRQPD